ncbi:hypothetical protein CF319_g7636 [Tilletia indica]|uniref:Uncharacterized protein n=1 Tax=Tilletia indica TaxID=43049 RepID=A0A8T8SAE8_9BASI|nr:hypothetical protein CF319_g7636 [Tilletia indica]KAE8236051.1 hypothetical protein A4X13_0g9282 [Tilletia indica]
MGKRTNTYQQRVVQHGPGPLNGTFSSTQGGRSYYCFTENIPAIVLSQRGTVVELSEDEDDSDEDFDLAHPVRTTATGAPTVAPSLAPATMAPVSAPAMTPAASVTVTPTPSFAPTAAPSLAPAMAPAPSATVDPTPSLAPAVAPSLATSTAPAHTVAPAPASTPPHPPLPSVVAPTVAPAPTWAAAHLQLRDARSPAARRAIGGTPTGHLTSWWLEDVVSFDPSNPPSMLKKTKGSSTAYFDPNGNQVKERWRCLRCDSVRTVDPKHTGVMSHHTRRLCPSTST